MTPPSYNAAVALSGRRTAFATQHLKPALSCSYTVAASGRELQVKECVFS
jgi:hypothetical protein